VCVCESRECVCLRVESVCERVESVCVCESRVTSIFYLCVIFCLVTASLFICHMYQLVWLVLRVITAVSCEISDIIKSFKR